MRPTNLLFLLVSFTFLCSALSVKEWKKFENGKVKIHKKQDNWDNLKDIPNGKFKKGEQHFLHGHHLARLKNRQEKLNTDKFPTDKGLVKGTKDNRHTLENGNTQSSKRVIPNQSNIPEVNLQSLKLKNDNENQQKLLKAKQNKMNRLEKFQFDEKNEKLSTSKEKKNTKQDGKKKLGMTKMEGNVTAKKIWKHIIRDQVKAEERFQIPKGNIPPETSK